MPDETKIDGHLTPVLAAKMARLAGVRKLVLTHFYKEVASIDILSRTGEVFDGTVLLARDGMLIKFNDR
jgi:ribonuclease BN (tRNA processing enzyme)